MERAAPTTTPAENNIICSAGFGGQAVAAGAQRLPSAVARAPTGNRHQRAAFPTKVRQRSLLPRPPPPTPFPTLLNSPRPPLPARQTVFPARMPALQALPSPVRHTIPSRPAGCAMGTLVLGGEGETWQTLQTLQADAHLRWVALQGAGSSGEASRRGSSRDLIQRIRVPRGNTSNHISERGVVAMRQEGGTGSSREDYLSHQQDPLTVEAPRLMPLQPRPQQPQQQAECHNLPGIWGAAWHDPRLGVSSPPFPFASIPSVAMPFFAPRTMQPENAPTMPMASAAETAIESLDAASKPGLHTSANAGFAQQRSAAVSAPASQPPSPPTTSAGASTAGAAATTAARQHQPQKQENSVRSDREIVRLEELVDGSHFCPVFVIVEDDDDDGKDAAAHAGGLCLRSDSPSGLPSSRTFAEDLEFVQNTNGHAAETAAPASRALAGRVTNGNRKSRRWLYLKTCCPRRCHMKWPLEKLAEARGAVPIRVSPFPRPPPDKASSRGGDGGGRSDDGGGGRGWICEALRKSYVKDCLTGDAELLYITGGQASLPVCRSFFSAVTGIPEDAVESATADALRTKRKQFLRSARTPIAPARRTSSPSRDSRYPLATGWWYSAGTRRLYNQATERWSGNATHELPCKVIQVFIIDLASHWQLQGESNRVLMSYPTRKAVYDLFLSDWEKGWGQSVMTEQPNDSCSPGARAAPPSYDVFIATWDEYCGHIGLKDTGRRQDHDQHRHQHQQHQAHQQPQQLHQHQHLQLLQVWQQCLHQQQQQQQQQQSQHRRYDLVEERQQLQQQQEQHQQQQQQHHHHHNHHRQRQQPQQQLVPLFPSTTMWQKPTTEALVNTAATAATTTTTGAAVISSSKTPAATAAATSAASALVGGGDPSVEAPETQKPLVVPVVSAGLHMEPPPPPLQQAVGKAWTVQVKDMHGAKRACLGEGVAATAASAATANG